LAGISLSDIILASFSSAYLPAALVSPPPFVLPHPLVHARLSLVQKFGDITALICPHLRGFLVEGSGQATEPHDCHEQNQD
jgi:hypothetical protein